MAMYLAMPLAMSVAVESGQFLLATAEVESQTDGVASVVRPAVVALFIVGAFVFGLTRIREQRRSGRTSKFPRIG